VEQPKQPLNFEQAVNFLEEKKETLAEDTKKEVREMPITDLSTEACRQYLMYGLNLLTYLSPAVRRMIPGEFLLGGGQSTRELIRSMKHYLTLRIYGYSIIHISRHLGRSVQVLLKMEKATIMAVKEAIEDKKKHGIPILGRG